MNPIGFLAGQWRRSRWWARVWILVLLWLPLHWLASVYATPLELPKHFLAWRPEEVVRTAIGLLIFTPPTVALLWMPSLLGDVLGASACIQLLILPLAVAAWWLRRPGRRIARRIARGECVACGHRLRPEQDRCPECGRTRTGPRIDPAAPEPSATPRSRRRSRRWIRRGGRLLVAYALAAAITAIARHGYIMVQALRFMEAVEVAEANGISSLSWPVRWTVGADLHPYTDPLPWWWGAGSGFDHLTG